MAWGYDNPLSEYFLTQFLTKEEERKVIKHNQRLRPDDNNYKDEEVVFSIMSHTTTVLHPDYPDQLDFANSEFLEIMEQYPPGTFPKEHIESIVLDLPF